MFVERPRTLLRFGIFQFFFHFRFVRVRVCGCVAWTQQYNKLFASGKESLEWERSSKKNLFSFPTLLFGSHKCSLSLSLSLLSVLFCADVCVCGVSFCTLVPFCCCWAVVVVVIIAAPLKIKGVEPSLPVNFYHFSLFLFVSPLRHFGFQQFLRSFGLFHSHKHIDTQICIPKASRIIKILKWTRQDDAKKDASNCELRIIAHTNSQREEREWRKRHAKHWKGIWVGTLVIPSYSFVLSHVSRRLRLAVFVFCFVISLSLRVCGRK